MEMTEHSYEVKENSGSICILWSVPDEMDQSVCGKEVEGIRVNLKGAMALDACCQLCRSFCKK